MSICASDLSTTMDTLARESIALSEFPLSDEPIEDTIEVEIDGIISTAWTYSESTNAITFTTVPSDGSNIDVTYASWSCQ